MRVWISKRSLFFTFQRPETCSTTSLESIKNVSLSGDLRDTANAAFNFATEVYNNIDVNQQTTGLIGFSDQRLTPAGSIALYIPDNVNFSYNAQYGEINLGGQSGMLTGMLTKLPGIIGKGANFVAGTDVGRLFLRSQGIALNPNQQVMFDGIDLRTFSFDFNFMPKSREEAKDVKDIIKAFKKYSRPRTVEKTFGLVFVPPSIFEIKFMFLNGENTWVNKVARSVITNIEVEYTPNGWSTHQDGSPVNTKLKLEFKELSLIDRKAVEIGGY